jgi:hypothetical protein
MNDNKPNTNRGRPFLPAATDTFALFRALDELLTLENTNGYTFQASEKAYRSAREYIEVASAELGSSFLEPEFVPDGEAGIDIEWNRAQRTLTLSCRGSGAQKDYIYWEENGSYEVKDASLSLLINRLEWLSQA